MTIAESSSVSDLKSLFCERLQCPPSEFEKRAFQKCLYFHARVIAPLLRLFDPGWFERDLQFIRDLGNAKSWPQVIAELDAFRYREHLQPVYARSKWRLRVSARKANKLAFDLFPSS
jgi:hypothetical protein